MEYFDFGTPISFGLTAQYLPQKTVTRRDWKEGYATKFAHAFDRAVAAGKKLRVPAIDKAYRVGGKQIGWLVLSHAPYKEVLKEMPRVDLVTEGGMCNTIEEFATKYFKGDLEKEVWVLRFKFLPLQASIDAALDPVTEAVSNPPTKTKTLETLTSSGSDEHFTPTLFANAARQVMSNIDLDPMSCTAANKFIRADHFYDKELDGLKQPWTGKVWLNPAFSVATPAVKKLIKSYNNGDVTEALLLLRAAPDTKRHHMLTAFPFCELNKRIKFIAEGNVGAPFACLIFYLGRNFPRFKEVFSQLGNIRLGQSQVDELENDRRDLLTEVARLQLELAKKSEASSDKREPNQTEWLERDLAASIGIADSRLQELELDKEILPDDLYIRQRVEWRSRLQALQEVKEAMTKIAVRFTAEYDHLLNREHPQIELSEEKYTPDFAPQKWVESSAETGSLLVRIENYRHTDIGWIAECNVRRSDRVSRNSVFLIKASELFTDFHPWKGYEREIIQPIYSLGSIRTAKGLKNHFPGIKLPPVPRPDSTEVKAPDNSVWQACKDGWSERAAIKWRCEVLPNGFSRSPRIHEKTAASTTVKEATNNINYSYEC